MPLSRHWIPLTLVLAVHMALLAAVVYARHTPPLPEPQVMQVVMIPPQLEVAPAREPEPTPPEPTPQPPEPRLLPTPVVNTPTPEPVPPAPPPETAINPEPPAPPPPVLAPSTAPVAAAEPVTEPPKVDASYKGNRQPGYPPLSRRLNEQGTVLLDVQVLTDGRVGDIRVGRSSGHDRLDQAALQAVKRWKFTPATRGGIAVAARYKLPIEFNLSKAEK